MLKKKYLIGGALLIFVVAIVVLAVILHNRNNPTASNNSDSTQSESVAGKVTVVDPSVSSDEASSEDTISDNGTGLTPSEPDITVPDNRTGEIAQPAAEAKQPVISSDTAVSVSTDKKYVQDANPETGISWDGKSAITYRYADGSETTEKRYGGYYEIRPNEWMLYARPLEKEEENNKCSHCGKVMGDGTNGTCVRWMMGDMTCPVCGEFVPANTCHTCKE